MAYKYIYIDDEPVESTTPYTREVIKHNRKDQLEIKHLPPKPWDDLQSFLKNTTYDGIILDLKLNQFKFWFDDQHKWSSTDKKIDGKAKYTGIELAQLLRTLGTEDKLPDCPIILWSTESRVKNSAYSRDKTSHDLFDLKILKKDLERIEIAKRVNLQMISLIKGYQELASINPEIKGKNQFYKFLGWEDDPEFLDPRLLSFFDNHRKPIPLHELARFILRKLLEVSGPLINKYILAARLGIDIEKSKDFEKLIKKLPENIKYNGPFNEGWTRWWSFKLEEWWLLMKDNPGPLKRVPAKERVLYLREKTNLKNLTPFDPARKFYNTNYWTICQATKTPLSPSDGFLVDFQYKLPWQNNLYVSMEAIEQRLLKENKIAIDPLEKSRLKEAKKYRKSE